MNTKLLLNQYSSDHHKGVSLLSRHSQQGMSTSMDIRSALCPSASFSWPILLNTIKSLNARLWQHALAAIIAPAHPAID
jgi:hypothetical protein